MKSTSLKKKSLSPLISTILLVVVAVILVTLVLIWGKTTINNKTGNINKVDLSSGFSGLVYAKSYNNRNLLIINTYKSSKLKIIGYKIIPKKNKKYANILKNNYFFKETLVIEPNSSEFIEIHCIPENSFYLDLILEDHTFLKVNVNINGNVKNLCSIYEGLVFAVDFREGSYNDLFSRSMKEYGTGYLEQGNKGLYYTAGDITSGSIITYESLDTDDFGNVFSVVNFIKRSTEPVSSSGRDYFGKLTIGAPPWVSFLLESETSAGKYRISLGSTDNVFNIFNSSKILKEDNCIIYTYDGSYLKSYLNGVLDISTSFNKDIKWTTTGSSKNFNVSSVSNVNSMGNGGVYVARVYNRILTNSELDEIYEEFLYSRSLD